MASRKGIEPPTPGLGNLCSILLSYRDKTPRHTTAPARGRARLAGRAALAALTLAAAPAGACGTPTGFAVLSGVSAAGDLTLAPGGASRLQGLDLDAGALVALSALAGRTLGVAELEPGADRWGRRAVDLFDADGRSVSLRLLQDGEARVRAEPGARSCEAERLEAERDARSGHKGLWAKRGAVIDATDLSALAASEGRFALVRGRVKRTGATARRLYIDFEPFHGLSVLVPRKLEAQFRQAGRDMMDLAGRMVLVRGVLDNRFGPRIEIVDPAMIEPLESGKESSRGG